MSLNCSQFKNPSTSLAFLTPSEAAQIEATRFLYVASLSAFIWDFLSTLSQDYHLLTRYAINIPTIVYFFSRITSLAFITTATTFYAAPVHSCHMLSVATNWCWTVAAPSTSFLFFIRARAVFDNNPLIVTSFTMLWLATVGGSFAVPFSITGDQIASTDRCWNTSFSPLSSAGVIASFLSDTFVFIAVTWHVIRCTEVKGKAKSLIGGRDLPHISKELVKGGQQYYFITLTGNIVTIILLLIPSTPPLVRAMFPIPSKALENVMACRVFRNIKLGRGASDPERHTSATEVSSPNPRTPAIALRTLPFPEERQSRQPVMQITKTVERFDDRDSEHSHIQSKPNSLPHTEDEFV